MALTQMPLIQSLGEAMAWFERELQWGGADRVAPFVWADW